MNAQDICYLPAVELVRLIREREVFALEVMQAHLDQIGRTNPRINAIVTLLVDSR
jgi:amidase